MFPVILPLSFHLRSLSAVFVRRCTRNAQALRPIRAKDFRLNQAREYAAPAAGDVRRFRRGNQKGRHLRFLPSWDSRFPLLVSPAKIGERRPLRNWSTTVGLLQRVFLRLFAVHRQITATHTGYFPQARHTRAAQLVSLEFADSTYGLGVRYNLSSQVLSIITC